MNDRERTILVVDDAPGNIQLLSGILKEKYKVKAATSGEKALKIANKLPQPDLILLNIMMLEMDGYEVCRLLKSTPETRGIPVIFVTGKLTREDEQRGMDMGAVGYLT
ncbi:response regulator [Solemya velesiana gill symbiont]|uniref:Response regulatory domain-containing protein n=1 Tax=Solemya velesiana gill symbiont TaxID=1918948 RepID=A0A1T2KUY9_9GAMM|nr:hypothetical protein BOW51_06515 [Solemya velesiana gill symbiont]